MLTFAERVTLRNHHAVVTYRGRMADGSPLLAYLLCREQQLAELRQDYLNQTARSLADYNCTILYADCIEEEDERAKAFLNRWLAEQEEGS